MGAGPTLPQWPDFLLTLLPPPSSTSSHLFMCCLSSHVAQTPCISCLLGLRQFIQSPTPNSCDCVAVGTPPQACWCQCAQISPFSNSLHGVSCLLQIPTVVGESRSLCSVESATRSCFQGVSAMQMSLGVRDRYRLLTNLPYRTITPHSTPDNLMEPVTCHAMNFYSRAHRNSQKRRGEYPFHPSCRPKSLLKTHQSVCPCFSGAEPSNQRGEIPLLVTVWASHPPVAPDLLPTVSHWDGHAPCSVWNMQELPNHGTEVQSLINNNTRTIMSDPSRSPNQSGAVACVSLDSLVVSADTSETQLIWGSQYFPHEGSWLIISILSFVINGIFFHWHILWPYTFLFL